MPKNPYPASQLDLHQMARQSFMEADDSFRVILGDGIDLEIELNAADGDSVKAVSDSLSSKASLTSASSGVVIAAQSAIGMRDINLVSKTTSTIVGSQILTLELSPHDSDDIWYSSSLTNSPSTVSGTVVASTPITILARRVRVSIAAPITSGTLDLYLEAHN